MLKKIWNHEPRKKMTKEVKKVVSWAIQVEWSDGTVENLNDLPNGVANTVDEWLTENEKLLNLENV